MKYKEMTQKAYKVTFACIDLKTGENSYNIDSINVRAVDAPDAISVSGNYFIEKEKEYLKDKLQVFIESIDFICEINVEK